MGSGRVVQPVGRRRVRWTVSTVLLVTAVLAGCTAPAADPPTIGRALTLPDVPASPRAGVVVDAAHLDGLACGRCVATAGELGVEEFLYGDVPVAAIRALAGPVPLTDAERAVALGDLVASGYHGGRWLAAGLGTVGVEPAADPATRTALLAIGDGFLGTFTDLARDAGAAADRADPESTAGLALTLAAVAGYNRGYLELALERPPTGVTPPTDAVTCTGALTCTSARFPLGDVDRWVGVGDQLAGGSGRWADARALLDALVPATERAGRDVWLGLLGGSGLPAEGYAALIDTSAGFLAITGLALRAALSAWATGDRSAARTAYDVTAGLALWAGSYFVGLAAPPGDPLPTLDCSRVVTPPG